jgi:hypothetical protein
MLASHYLPPGRFLILIFVGGLLERLGQLKNPVTSSGIEPSSFWFVE